jgi:primase-polymerase (primpol)-like protein
MNFVRKLIPLNILASGGNANLPFYMVPNGSSKITVQFKFSDLATNATLTLQQSANGSDFDPVFDSSGNPVTLLLDKDKSSATINLVNLLTLWIRFQVDFAAAETGSIDSVQYLTT